MVSLAKNSGVKVYSSFSFISPSATETDKATTLLRFAVGECGLDGVTFSVTFSEGFIPSVRVSVTGYPDSPFIESGAEDDRITIERFYPVKA